MVGVTPSTTRAVEVVLAEPLGLLRQHISLMHGPIPVLAQVLAALLLVAAVGWRTRRWRLLWLPVAASAGAALALGARWNITSSGMAGEPAPRALWVWIAVTGFAAAIAVLGWRSARWWRRAVALAAVPLCAVSAGLMLNGWVGYFPTVQTAWAQLTGGPLPGQTDRATVARMLAERAVPTKGSVVPVEIPSTASKFRHRGELVYLPPAYFAINPPPELPVVMMIGGQFNTPADWLRAGNAIATIDDFAARHDGNAPVFVFVDSGGSFNNDTECVNGVRGNAADHLTEDVVPYLVDNFGVSADAANWGVVGWSSGGTCAMNLTVKYPESFSAFVDIDGDIAPNAGTKAQTIERLYGGRAAAYDEWDPATIIERQGPYEGVAGWFAVSVPPGTRTMATIGAALPDPAPGSTATTPQAAARTLCKIGAEYGIDCAVVPEPGKHDWPFAARVLASSLPWLAGRLGTPKVPAIPLPGSPPADGVSVAAAGSPLDPPIRPPSGVR